MGFEQSNLGAGAAGYWSSQLFDCFSISPSPSLRDRFRRATNYPGKTAEHRKKNHCHPSLRVVVLKRVCDKRRKNRNCCYLAHESYCQATPVKDFGETIHHLAFARSPSSTRRTMASDAREGLAIVNPDRSCRWIRLRPPPALATPKPSL
jgi:hypothetical protein